MQRLDISSSALLTCCLGEFHNQKVRRESALADFMSIDNLADFHKLLHLQHGWSHWSGLREQEQRLSFKSQHIASRQKISLPQTDSDAL